MRKGILIDKSNELSVRVKRINGLITQGLVIGDSQMQDAYLVLSLNQGELAEDPLCGANLLRMIRKKENSDKMKKMIELSLERMGIKFEDIKSQMEFMTNNERL